MNRLPIEYFTAKLTRHDPLLQWIEFRGGHHWLRRSEKDCEFTVGLASEVYDVFEDGIILRDTVGNQFETEITQTLAPEGFSDFGFLPESKKRILNVKVHLGNETLDRLPLHFFSPTLDKKETHIFTIEPSILYPTFLFDAVQNYGHLVAKHFVNFVETGSLYGHTTIHAAHYGYPSDTAHGGESPAPTPQEQKPILSELSTILERFDDAALVIIDDWNIVGVKGNDVFENFDWSHISQTGLKESFDAHTRIRFHCPLDDTRYVVGISAAK